MARAHKRKITQKPGHQLYLSRSHYDGARVAWTRLNERARQIALGLAADHLINVGGLLLNTSDEKNTMYELEQFIYDMQSEPTIPAMAKTERVLLSQQSTWAYFFREHAPLIRTIAKEKNPNISDEQLATATYQEKRGRPRTYAKVETEVKPRKKPLTDEQLRELSKQSEEKTAAELFFELYGVSEEAMREALSRQRAKTSLDEEAQTSIEFDVDAEYMLDEEDFGSESDI